MGSYRRNEKKKVSLVKKLFIGTSSSRKSINNDLMIALSSSFDCFCIDFRDYLDIPMLLEYHEDLRIPEKIRDLFNVISNFEELVLFSPEHNAYISAFLKNILDWLSLIKKEFLEGKRVILVSASNTSRLKRRGEESIKSTFFTFSPKEFIFFNFNEYDSDYEIKLNELKKII